MDHHRHHRPDRDAAPWPALAAGALAPVRHARRHPRTALVAVAVAVVANRVAALAGAPGWAFAAALAVLAVSCILVARAGPRSLWRYLGALVTAGVLAGVLDALASRISAGVIAVAVAAVLAGWWLLDTVTGRPHPGSRRRANSHFNADGSPKVEYASRTEALAAGRRLTDRDGAAMSAYRCSRGGHWHIGHAR